MKPSSFHFTAVIAITILAAISCLAQDDISNSIKTVEQLYPNLAAGLLTYAKVSILPDGVLMKTDGIEITQKDIDQTVAQQPEQLRDELKKNAFFVLEQEATGMLLLKIAKDELSKQNKDITAMPDNELINVFFENLVKDINVTNQDIETFYKENESVFCGTPLDKVRKQIESYVLQDKKQRFVDRYVQTLGQKIEITVSDPWTKTQVEFAKDNPLDKARASGKPTLVVFSAKSCCGPDKMLPVINTIQVKYNDNVNIVYIEPQKEQILSARYGIRSIPTQVFYDAKGKEFFRHSGFFSDTDIVAKLTEIGVK
jgi:thiol-disulfide isomerase/thioredoxin